MKRISTLATDIRQDMLDRMDNFISKAARNVAPNFDIKNHQIATRNGARNGVNAVNGIRVCGQNKSRTTIVQNTLFRFDVLGRIRFLP